jgi:hypothetical protein
VPPDLRASYAFVEAYLSGYSIEHRRVDYDREAVVAALERLRHPGAAFLIRHLRGQYKPVGVQVDPATIRPPNDPTT